MAVIPDEGKIELLTAQFAYLATCKWCLFTTDYAVVAGTTLADLLAIEANWIGYARVVVGSLNPATISGAYAITTPVTAPTFTNTDVSNKTFYGWFLVNSAVTKLVNAVNLGTQTLLVGGTIAIMETIRLKGV